MHECPHGKMSCFYLISFLPNNVSMHCKLWVKHEMIQTWGFCNILWFKKLDYNPTQHLYTWAIQNRVLTLRCWKSSTNFEIFKIQLAKETRKNNLTGRLQIERLVPSLPPDYIAGLTGLAMDLRTRGGRLRVVPHISSGIVVTWDQALFSFRFVNSR